MSLSKVGQVILPVKDLSTSTSFYRDKSGMKVKYAIADEFTFFDGGGIELVLRGSPSSTHPDLTEIVFQVQDVQGMYSTLKSNGVVFSYPPRAVTGNAESQLFASDFRDPDGHVLSITGWVRKQ